MHPSPDERFSRGDQKLNHLLLSHKPKLTMRIFMIRFWSGVSRLEIWVVGLRQALTDGEREGEGRTFSFFARHPHPAAMGFDDHLADHEPEAGSFLCRNGCAAPLAILLKEVWDFISRNAETAVFNLDDHSRAVFSANSDLDGATVLAEFEGVTQEIIKDLIEPAPVGIHRWKGGVQLRA